MRTFILQGDHGGIGGLGLDLVDIGSGKSAHL